MSYTPWTANARFNELASSPPPQPRSRKMTPSDLNQFDLQALTSSPAPSSITEIQSLLIPNSVTLLASDIATIQLRNPSHAPYNFDPVIFEDDFPAQPSHPVDPSDESHAFKKFTLEQLVWLDAMMIRRQSEGRLAGLFVTDAQEFNEKFGWTPLFSDFLHFASEYEKDCMFYCNFNFEERLYPELGDIGY
jgi:hypothetical protein